VTFEERVEKAEAVMFDLFPADRGLYREEVEQLIRAAFPDLYGEKPTAWIAPMEPTPEMVDAADRCDGGAYDEGASGYRHFEEMRDAHLKRG